MKKELQKTMLILIMLVLITMIASRHYFYRGYNVNSATELSQQLSSNIIIITNALFLFISFLPLFIEIGLILFLIKNRREITELIRNLKNGERVSQKKRSNLLMQILAWILVLALLSLMSTNKAPLNSIGIKPSNSTNFSNINLNVSTNVFSSYIQGSISAMSSIINNFSLIALVILLTVLIMIGVRAFHNRSEPYNLNTTLDKQLESIVTDTLHELKNSSKVQNNTKNIIVKCYSEMCQIIREAGREPKSYETAREFEKACLQTFQWLPAKPLHDLTLLFEETLYSNHEITEDKISIAINSLEEIRKSMVMKNDKH